MKLIKSVLIAVFGMSFSATYAQWYEAEEVVVLTPVKHEQRVAARHRAEQNVSSGFAKSWADTKQEIRKLGLDVGVDVSYTFQRVSPNGKQTAIQGIYYPFITWNLFKDRAWGSGQFNANYNLVRYWGAQAATLQGRANLATAFNDYAANQEIFSQLSYTHTLPGDMNWLSVTVGQFPLYNFDGTTYIANQQTALMNYALSQNASSAYPSASLGAYVQAQNKTWSLTAGYQDATNVSGSRIKFKDAFDGKYTVFGSLAWTPSFELGQGQYSVLYYYQPSVEDQPENVNGWSFNMQQNMGEKWALFGRANGSTNGAMGIKNSYALGLALLNPLERNSQDAIIAGVAYNRLSEAGMGYPAYMRSSEMAVELQWIWGIGQLITITPDLQLYPNAGLDKHQGLTTVIGLRTTIQL